MSRLGGGAAGREKGRRLASRNGEGYCPIAHARSSDGTVHACRAAYTRSADGTVHACRAGK